MSEVLHLAVPSAPDDIESELAKDIWDVRKLGCRYNTHRATYFLNFTKVPLRFRPLAKRFIQLQVAHYSHNDCLYKLKHTRAFLQYYATMRPEATDLRDLTRADVESYLVHLWNTPIKDGKPATHNHVSRSMNVLKLFLEYLQRTGSPEAPRVSASQLVWPEDCRCPKGNSDRVKYIPEYVLEQIDRNLDKLSDTMRPIVIVLRASGWRIADVLNLRYHNCLEKTQSGWWLVGDIKKTQTQHHRVPISEEIAKIVAARCDDVQLLFTDEENPEKYLFATLHRGNRLGSPVTAEGVLHALYKLADTCNITDEQGKPCRFGCHSFRHTKGVELINNGMNILHVQKWLAHVSPEMTLRYARILDSTMRQEWEKVMAKGALRFTNDGSPVVRTVEELQNEDQIEWDYIRDNLDAVRLPHGYCLKPNNMECVTQDMPCYQCHYLCTTPDFLPEYLRMRQEALERIQDGEMQGRIRWVELNRQVVGRIEPIIQVLEQQKLHNPAGKARREYTQEERAKRNAGKQKGLQNEQQTLL